MGPLREWAALVLPLCVGYPGMVNELRQALTVALFLGDVSWEHTSRACVLHEQDRWLGEHLGHNSSFTLQSMPSQENSGANSLPILILFWFRVDFQNPIFCLFSELRWLTEIRNELL